MRSQDPYFRDTPGAASPEEIAKCLSCEKVRCDNCLSREYRTSHERIFLDGMQLVRVYNKGYSLQRMARELGLHNATLYRRLNTYGLQVQTPRPAISKATLKALPLEQRRFILWKGEPMA